jgi:hypothetical protein
MLWVDVSLCQARTSTLLGIAKCYFLPSKKIVGLFSTTIIRQPFPIGGNNCEAEIQSDLSIINLPDRKMLVCGKKKTWIMGSCRPRASFWFLTNHDYRREQKHYGWLDSLRMTAPRRNTVVEVNQHSRLLYCTQLYLQLQEIDMGAAVTNILDDPLRSRAIGGSEALFKA